MATIEEQMPSGAVSHDEIERIAKLSMLDLNESEMHSLEKDFNNILALFEALQKENLDTIKVQYTPEKTAQQPRTDEIIHDTENQIDNLSMVSPYFNKKSQLFDVPPVIETE